VNYIERSKEIIGIILKLKEAIISMKKMVLNIQYHIMVLKRNRYRFIEQDYKRDGSKIINNENS
jgi:hypothetical protein